MPRIDDIIDPSSEIPVADGVIPADRGALPPYIRITKASPVGGVVRLIGTEIQFVATPIGIPASTPIDELEWEVYVYARSRGAGEPHFWYSRETPYREFRFTSLPAADTFSMASDVALPGWSTWVIDVKAHSDSIPVAAGHAEASIEVDLEVAQAVMLPSPLPVIQAPHGVPVATGTATAVALSKEAVLVALVSDGHPGILLDPSQAG